MPSRTKLTIEDMQKIAVERGGKCLSEIYVNTKTRLIWECSEGHQWKTTPSEIRKGSWCPHCARNIQKLTIEEMQLLAKKRNGKCLSSVYVNNRTKLLWQCGEGHTWKATPQHIKDGTWCPYCGGHLPLTITEMKQIARERNGKCLSETYINNSTKLLWECSKGHQWEAAPLGIKSGTWCPYCAGTIPLSIEEMQEIAESKGGKCLSKTYINTDTPLLWQCKEGHQWEAVPNSIKNNGTWCPYCARTVPLTIEEMQEIAKAKGGKCLSKTYHVNHKHLFWQCDKGHQWKATPAHVKQGKWCPYCAGNAPLTLEDIQKIAREKGGECLSKTYVNTYIKLLFRCKEGHQWKTAPAYIKRGSWCPQCGGSFPSNIEEMRKIAEAKGGKCLSDTYVNANTALLWQCKKGHQWWAIPSSVKDRTWCPQCGGSFPLTIEKMREIAEERGGKCLSSTYTNTQTHLLWECSEGHQWKATPSNIQRGRWCPYCKHRYEEICRSYFQALFNVPFLRTRPDWLRNEDNNGLELDGFNEHLKIAFEHQGIQHYKLVPHFQESEEKFEKLQRHDEIKRRLCEEHNVLLIEIPQLFLLTNPKDLPLVVKQALEDANRSIPSKFHHIIVRGDGWIIDRSSDKSTVVELNEQLELFN